MRNSMFMRLQQICIHMKLLAQLMERDSHANHEELSAFLDHLGGERDDLIGRLIAPY